MHIDNDATIRPLKLSSEIESYRYITLDRFIKNLPVIKTGLKELFSRLVGWSILVPVSFPHFETTIRLSGTRYSKIVKLVNLGSETA